MAKPAFTIEQAQILRDRYERGETTVSLATEYGVKDSCVANWIKRAGGKIRSNSESKRKSTFDEHFWDSIDNELKAYWLGFFMADGYIGSYKGVWRNFWCTLAAKDGHHLTMFLTDIGATYSVAYYTRANKKTGKIYNKCRICLTSIPFVANLIKIGWLDFKRNGDLRLFNVVPDYLHNHFIRGFFDGDGSIGRQRRKRRKLSLSYTITIVAPHNHYAFLDMIRTIICQKTMVKDKPLKTGSSVWRCHWNGNRQVRRIGQWLYNGATRLLQRKKDRFDTIDRLVRFDWPPNNLFSCSHLPAEIAAMDMITREVVIDDFCRMVQASNWRAPEFGEELLREDYRAILAYNSDLYTVKKNDELLGFRLNTGGNAESPGKKIVLHFQPHFWNTRTTAPTIPDQWHNITLVRRAAAALLTTGTKVTFWRYLRELRYAGAGVTSHFHPNFAIAIISQLTTDAKSWFDPCMGWGGRLIASNALGIRYEGCDPQPDTFAGLIKIKSFIGADVATLHQIKAQEFVPTNEYDLGFTSPPFFNKEKYGANEQSYYQFPKYDLWMENFLRPVIDKMLVSCKRVILHVDNRMADTLQDLYQLTRYPLYLQRNPGGPQSAEAIVVLK
jgi:hypothetical protein